MKLFTLIALMASTSAFASPSFELFCKSEGGSAVELLMVANYEGQTSLMVARRHNAPAPFKIEEISRNEAGEINFISGVEVGSETRKVALTKMGDNMMVVGHDEGETDFVEMNSLKCGDAPF